MKQEKIMKPDVNTTSESEDTLKPRFRVEDLMEDYEVPYVLEQKGTLIIRAVNSYNAERQAEHQLKAISAKGGKVTTTCMIGSPRPIRPASKSKDE